MKNNVLKRILSILFKHKGRCSPEREEFYNFLRKYGEKNNISNDKLRKVAEAWECREINTTIKDIEKILKEL